MKSAIASYFQKQLEKKNIFASVHGLAELITETKSDGTGSKTFPALYKGNDALRYVTNFDYKNGLAFFLKGDESITEGESKRGDSRYMTYSVNLQFYCIVKRANEDELINELLNVLQIDNKKSNRAAFGVNAVRAFVSSYTTGADNVLPDIFSGIDIKAGHDMSYINMTVSFTASYYDSCIKIKCC
jgi:hypothetical protein